MTEHRLNYGRLFPGQTYKADCTCGWSNTGSKDQVYAAVNEHEKLIPEKGGAEEPRETRYGNHLIRVIGGYGSPKQYQVFGPKTSNGGRTWLSEHNSIDAAKAEIDRSRKGTSNEKDTDVV